MTTNQPAPMTMRTGMIGALLRGDGGEDRRRPGDERAEERDGHQQTRGDGGQHAEVEAEDDRGRQGDRAVGQAKQELATDEAAERAVDAVLEELRLLGVRRRHEAHEEPQDPRPVKGDVQAEDDDDRGCCP